MAELKFKEAQCLVAVGEPGAAIASLESIKKFARTFEMSATLARVYESSGLKRYALFFLAFFVPHEEGDDRGFRAGFIGWRIGPFFSLWKVALLFGREFWQVVRER